jgi:nitroimidazol reductase NimA-like FMN-containing flavoprotein (pyridoxamine 5'-phosphate oxidase superfamily)
MERDARTPGPASDRVRLRRGAARGVYDREAMLAVLDAGMVAHLGVVTEDGPIVLPMAYARTDDWLYLHGSAANAMLRAAAGHDVCATVTVLDALVVARSPFHNSMHYRGVVVRGIAHRVTDEREHLDALRRITDHVVPTWDAGRPPTAAEIRKTMVLAVPLVEMSAKIRDGGPSDEPEDLDGPHWGGHIPLHTAWGAPVPAHDLRAGIDVPPTVAAMQGRSAT